MGTKWCYACESDKDIDDFAKNKARSDGRNSMCKDCKKLYNATYYQDTKERHNPGRAERRRQAKLEAQVRVVEYLRVHPCVDCGETDIVVLEFDHQSDKLTNVNLLVADGVSWFRILAEIVKCEVVCANDHRRRTARAFGYYRARAV